MTNVLQRDLGWNLVAGFAILCSRMLWQPAVWL